MVINSPALESDVGWIGMSVNEVSVLDDQYTNTQKDIVWWDVQLLFKYSRLSLIIIAGSSKKFGQVKQYIFNG